MATSIDVLDVKGKKAGSVELPAELFDVQTNIPLIHQVVVAQLAAARQGSIRAPQMTGGGIVHGPVPRSYAQRTPKKMIAAALLGALSDRTRGNRLHAVESLALGETPSTKAVVEYLTGVATSKHVLIVLERDDEVSAKSVRNIPTVHVLHFDQLNAYDVLVSDDIVFTKGALEAFIAAKSAVTASDKEEVNA